MQLGFTVLVAAAVLLALCEGLEASPDALVNYVETVSGNDKPGRFLRISKFDEDDSDDSYESAVGEERGSFKLPSLHKFKLTRSNSLSRQIVSEDHYREVLKDLNREMKKVVKSHAEDLFRNNYNPDQVFRFFELDPKVVEKMTMPNANKYKIWEEATKEDKGVKYGAYRLWDLFSQLYKKQQPNWASELTRSQ